MSSRNSDRQVPRGRKDSLGNTKLPDKIQAIDHLKEIFLLHCFEYLSLKTYPFFRVLCRSARPLS